MKSFNTIKVSSLIALLSSIIGTLVIFFTVKSISLEQLGLIGVVIFISTIFIASLFTYLFIQKRVKGIYKMMGSLNPKTSGPIVQTDFINEVEEEVIDWASKRQEEINRLKETEEFRKEFIGNLAHELKTPVFSVQGYILTLLEGGLEDETINRKFLLKASKGIDRITTVIEDMDTITQIESGILALDYSRFDIVAAIKNIFFELEEKAKDFDIRLMIENKTNQPVFVEADRPKIAQVLYNLITNSIYYGTKGGLTIVKVNSVKDFINIEVIDNGPGISKEHIPRLFERFYRVEKSRVRNKGGSGIGLAIVKHVIDAHHQKITVNSWVGEGTSFSFQLKKG